MSAAKKQRRGSGQPAASRGRPTSRLIPTTVDPDWGAVQNGLDEFAALLRRAGHPDDELRSLTVENFRRRMLVPAIDPQPFMKLQAKSHRSPPAGTTFRTPHEVDVAAVIRDVVTAASVVEDALRERPPLLDGVLPHEARFLADLHAAVERFRKAGAERSRIVQRARLLHDVSNIYAEVAKHWERGARDGRKGERVREHGYSPAQIEALRVAEAALKAIVKRHFPKQSDGRHATTAKMLLADGVWVRAHGSPLDAAAEQLAHVLPDKKETMKLARRTASPLEETILACSGNMFLATDGTGVEAAAQHAAATIRLWVAHEAALRGLLFDWYKVLGIEVPGNAAEASDESLLERDRTLRDAIAEGAPPRVILDALLGCAKDTE